MGIARCTQFPTWACRPCPRDRETWRRSDHGRSQEAKSGTTSLFELQLSICIDPVIFYKKLDSSKKIAGAKFKECCVQQH